MPPTGANTKVKDPEYCNWLKVGLALYYLKDGLSSFIQCEVDGMHQFLIQKLYKGSAVPAPLCSSCNAKDVKQNRNSYTWNFRTACPQRLCDTWLTELLALHTNPTSNKLYCENCNVTAWPRASWECAKLYMPRGQPATNTGAAQSDSQALLTLMANCKYFHSKLSQGGIQLTHTVSTIRNKVVHSGDMRLSDNDRKSFIQDIIKLLEDPNHLKSLEECKQAVAEINKINTDSLDVFFNIDLEMKALSECVKDCRQELGVHKIETEITVDSLKEELKDLKVLFDNFEKETIDKVGDIDRKCQKMGTRVKKLSRTVTYVKGQVRIQNVVTKKAVDSLKRKAVTDKSQQNKKLQKLDKEMQLIKGSNSQASRATADRCGELDTKCKKMDTKVTKLSRTVLNVASGLKLVQGQVRTQNKRSSLIKKTVNSLQRKAFTGLSQQRKKVRKLDKEMQLLKGRNSQASGPTDVRDIQLSLIKAYESIQIISINPVFDNAVNWKDLEDFYTDIVIEEEKEESTQMIKNEQQLQKAVTSFRQIFEKGDNKVTRIILKAPAGQGKSTFCRKLVHTWCSVQKKRLNIHTQDEISDKSETSGLKDEDEMLMFDILLYICLRDISDEKTLMDMVYIQFPIHESQGLSHRSHLEALIGQAEDNRVLLIMDGLDEMHHSSPFTENIMQRRLYPNLTVLATTRPWKIDQLSLIRSAHIDLLLDLQGFSFDNSMLFAKRIFDKYYKDESAIAQFENDIRRNDVIKSIIHVPLLLLFIVHVWYERKSFPQTISELYLEMLNVMVNRYMEGKGRKEKKKEGQDDKKYLLPKAWPLENTTFIVNLKLRKLSLVKHFGEEFLAALCEVAYHFLVTAYGETSLVFDEEALLELLGKDGISKLQTALDLGILSKSESPGIFRKRICLTFLHNTVQEFLAAINICCREDRCNIFLNSLNTLNDVFQYERIIQFAAGIFTPQCQKIFEKIYEVCDKDIGKEYIQSSRKYKVYTLSRFYVECILEACGEPFNLKFLCVYADNQQEWNVLQSALRNTLNVRTWLKYLYLYSCILDDATLDLSESNCLKYLSLTNVTMKGKLLVSRCTQLEHLKMNNCALDDTTLDLSESKCLGYLSLTFVTMKGKLLVSRCTQLEHLKMNNCALDDTTLDLSESKCLQYLRLVDVTMKGKLLISKCTQLICLKLKDCTLDDDILDLSESTCLQYLRLVDVTMKGKLFLSKCTLLEYLKLNNCTLDDTTLDLSESECLEYLSLKDVAMKVRLLLSKCTKLTCLLLASCILEVDVFDLSECTCLQWFLCYKVTMTGKGRLLCNQPQKLILAKCNLGEYTLDLSVSTCLINHIPKLQVPSMYNTDLNDALLSLDLDLLQQNHQCSLINLEKDPVNPVFFGPSVISMLDDLNYYAGRNRDNLINLNELTIDNVTMSKECKEVFCNSLSQCEKLRRLSIMNVDLCVALLSLDIVKNLNDLSLDNVSMSKECKEVFCNSLSQCKKLQVLSIKNVDMCDALLRLDSVNYLNELSLDNVTISEECKEVFCNSLSQCKDLRRLSIRNIDLCENGTMRKDSMRLLFENLLKHKRQLCLIIENMDLDDALLRFYKFSALYCLELDNVTINIDSKNLLFDIISSIQQLQSLSLKNLDLSDGTHELYNMNNKTDLDSVNMDKISKELMCRRLQVLSLKNLDLGDGRLILNNLGVLHSLTIDNVTMCKDGYLMLCNSISKCKRLKLSLKNLDQDDAIPSFDNLKELELVNITMYLKCLDCIKSSEQRLSSISSHERETTLSIDMTANSCDKCVVNYTNKKVTDDDDDNNDYDDWHYLDDDEDDDDDDLDITCKTFITW